MELRKILQEDDILIPMQADSKEEAIRQLAGVLKEHEIVIDLDAFVKDVFLREAEGITGIGDYCNTAWEVEGSERKQNCGWHIAGAYLLGEYR